MGRFKMPHLQMANLQMGVTVASGQSEIRNHVALLVIKKLHHVTEAKGFFKRFLSPFHYIFFVKWYNLLQLEIAVGHLYCWRSFVGFRQLSKTRLKGLES